uniref:Uncharacterized protein LOC100186523 n=1 Tax=Phallusia mammillata TaxID=59560 RepID=A0A6F9DIP1_9ASCI|nr:uncharacterized protein LOC100186523 [Phallusia mammillata]
MKENSQWKPKSFQVYSFGLTILWCAEYGLKQNEMIEWSNELHQLVSLMCDEINQICLQEVYDHSHKHESPTSINDEKIITELCESIVGSILELSSFSELLHLDGSVSECSRSLNDSVSSVDTTPSRAAPYSKINTSSTSDMEKCDMKPSVSVLKKSSPKKPFSDKTNTPSSDLPLKPNGKVKPNSSMLSKCEGEIKELNIHPSGFPNAQTHFLISYPDRSQASVTCGQVGMVQLLRSALDSWIHDIDQQYFALAYWEDSEYHFIQTFVELQNRVKLCEGKQVFYLRILYFPPNTNNIDANMLRAMYFQLRVDLLDERITCIYDDALSTAALALQHEIGDYKQEYKNEYFKMDEFVPSNVVAQLGTAHVRQQVIKLHRQLAGIGQKEAQVLFLRRCSNLEEYGTNFHKTFRLKSCKSENATWLGVGPRGISVFDLKSNNSRMKRHFLKWTDLKKMNCKNRKLTFCVMNPDVKLKFYQKIQQRANYLLTVIGKLHQFYSIQKPNLKVSSLGLFDDMTRLSSSTNPSPSRKSSLDTTLKPPRSPLQACFTNSSIDQTKQGKQPKAITIDSFSSSTPSIDTTAVRKSSLKSQSTTVSGQNVTEKHQPSSQGLSTPSHFVRNFRTIRRPSSASSSSSASRRRQRIATSTPGLSDARSTWSVPNDEYISPVTRANKRNIEVTSKFWFMFT